MKRIALAAFLLWLWLGKERQMNAESPDDLQRAPASSAPGNQEPNQTEVAAVNPSSTGPYNLPMPTMGGKQLWTDLLFFHDWHIQKNALTGHCRLLDGNNIRWGWGTFDDCRRKLEDIKTKKSLPPMSGKGVIVLHGLGRSSSSMRGMAKYLADQGHYEVFPVAYASTRGDVAAHAKALASVIENLEGIEEIHFVAHSLGNLVIRHYLADTTGRRPDPRIGRIVMLGPPNDGSRMARIFGQNYLFEAVAGASASQIASKWNDLQSRMAIPACEFAIIAGGAGHERGRNPLLEGDDDLVVSVAETRLPGASDFAVLPVFHTFMMDDATVQECTLRFLQHGWLIAPDRRQPIPLPAAADHLIPQP